MKHKVIKAPLSGWYPDQEIQALLDDIDRENGEVIKIVTIESRNFLLIFYKIEESY